MSLLQETFIAIVVVAALASVTLAVFVARRSWVPGAVYLAVLMAGAAVWCAAYAAELAASSLAGKLFWARLEYAGIVLVAPSWLLFCLAYLGLLRRRALLCLYVLPAVTLVLALLAPGLPLVWERVRLEPQGSWVTLVVDHGPWFWIDLVYAYAVVAAGSILLIRGVYLRVRVLTAQVVVLAGAAVLPWVANALSITGAVPFSLDLTPPVFALSVVLVVAALHRLEFLEVFPAMVTVAHDTVLDQMQDAVIVTDVRGRILSANPAAARFFGNKTREIVRRPLDGLLTLRAPGGEDLDLGLAAGRDAEAGVRVLPRASGGDLGRDADRVLDGVVSRLGTPRRPRGYVLVARDVTEREGTLRTLAESEDRLRLLFDQSPVAVLVFNEELAATECNDRMAEVAGMTREELIGAKLPSAGAPRLDQFCRGALRGETASYDGPVEVPGGKDLWLQGKVSPLRSRDGSAGGMFVAWDVTGAKRAEALADRLAFYDPLTGLPNRSLFRDRLRQSLGDAERGQGCVALAVLHFDRFETLKEASGHRVADRLLQEQAARLERIIRRGDTLARVAGDELGFIMPHIAGSLGALAIGEKLLASVRAPCEVEGRTYSITASLGIAVFPDDAEDGHALIENAERALRRAREDGGDRQQFYDVSMNFEAAERLEIEQGLRTALDEGHLEVYYEPQLSLRDGQIRGVEALVRWNHPERGVVPPLEFIPVAEQAGLIGRVDAWVLKTACRLVASNNRRSGGNLRVAVNLSPQDLRGAALVDTIRIALAESGLAADLLEIELTETAVITDLEASRQILTDVRALGVRVVLDDFGTGYASLTHLHGLPVDRVKIDRSFVMRCEEDEDAASIVAALVGLAHSLHLEVVAEGIETVGQAAFLSNLGCDEGQGYLYARAAPADACPALACWTEPILAPI